MLCAGKRERQRLPPRRPRLYREPGCIRWPHSSSVQGSIVGLIGEIIHTASLWPPGRVRRRRDCPGHEHAGAVVRLGAAASRRRNRRPPRIGDPLHRFRTLALIRRVLPSRHVFVIFDLEAVFIVAWAVAFRELGWGGYIEVV